MKNPSSYLYPQNEEYQRTENIATDGRAYIKTGYKPFFDGSSGTRVLCVLEDCKPIDGMIFGNDDINFSVENGKYMVKYSDQEQILTSWRYWVPNSNYRNLPKEYKQVEYLESDGTQIIGTRISGQVRLEITVRTDLYDPGSPYLPIEDYLSKIFGADNNYRLSFQIKRVYSYRSGGYAAKYGAESSNSGTSTPSDDEIEITFPTYSSDNGTDEGSNDIDISPNADFGEIVSVIFDSITGYFSINDQVYSRTIGEIPDTELYIFNIPGNGSVSTGLFGRIYSAKVYQEINNQLIPVRDFVPCIRVSDNKPGLYDLVDGYFFENDAASFGDGISEVADFAYGEEVTERIAVRSSDNIDYSDKIFTIDLTHNSFRIIHEGLEEKLDFTTPEEFDSENSFHIFSTSLDNTASQPVKLRRFKIFSGAQLIHDFIPAYWKPNKDPGLYDLVGGVFYTNESGSGITKELNEAGGWTVNFTGDYTREINEALGYTIDIL